jgi:hypothetical protein
MSKAQWRQTGAGPHEDRRTNRNRDRQAQKRHAIEEEIEEAPDEYIRPRLGKARSGEEFSQLE